MTNAATRARDVGGREEGTVGRPERGLEAGEARASGGGFSKNPGS